MTQRDEELLKEFEELLDTCPDWYEVDTRVQILFEFYQTFYKHIYQKDKQ
ncbi:MAG: hypothetical protein CM15mV131_490 [uncultured marine virus]|nr:MAG: hypothetical protein CM15mV131_490 [uncultured marine virus]